MSRYELLEFKGTDSHDNDPVEGGYCIVDYDWKWPDEAYWTWESLDGGSQAEARFSPPGEYTVELEVTDDEIWKSDPNATCTVNVVQVGLSGGGELRVNDDDDNNNGTLDKDETGTVSGENDLVAIELSVAPTNLPGVVRLEAVGDTKSCVKIWKYSDKGQLEIPDSGNHWKEYAPNALPGTLYVEGISPTSIGSTVFLSLKYKAPSWGEVYQSYDYYVTFTVCGNPSTFSITIYWKKWLGPEGHFEHDCYHARWDPQLSCWDSCYTSQDNKFQHAHITKDKDKFPITHEGETYTAAMSDRWYNDNRYTSDKGYSLVSTSYTAENCRGYGTARGCWITSDGMGVLLSDDYASASGTDAEFYTLGNPGTHAVKIHSFYPSGYIQKTREKNQTSGIYEKTYNDGDFAVGGHPTVYYWWKSK